MKKYHYRELNPKFQVEIDNHKKLNPNFTLSDIKIVKVGLVDYVFVNQKLIPVEEFFERKEANK